MTTINLNDKNAVVIFTKRADGLGRFDVANREDAVYIDAKPAALQQLAQAILDAYSLPEKPRVPKGWDELKVGDQFGFYRESEVGNRFPYVKISETEYHTHENEPTYGRNTPRSIENAGTTMSVFKKPELTAREFVESLRPGQVIESVKYGNRYISLTPTSLFATSAGSTVESRHFYGKASAYKVVSA